MQRRSKRMVGASLSQVAQAGKTTRRCRDCQLIEFQPLRQSLAAVLTLALLAFATLTYRLKSNAPQSSWIMASASAAAISNKASCSAIPRLGLGTMLLGVEQIPQAIPSAISMGYRRIDCAPVYFNEHIVGDAIQSALNGEGGVDRKDLFIVSKLASPFHRREHVELALKKTLADLRLDYLDCFLIHWPQAFRPVMPIPMDVRGWPTEEIDDSGDGKRIDTTVSVHETWNAMEDLVHKGLVKSIGVSNFPVSLLHELMTQAKIPPLLNQVEAHPYLQQSNLLKYCQARGVHFQAYSPLGTPGYKSSSEPNLLEDPVLLSIASKYNISVAQTCLTWAIQRGTSVVAKSGLAQHQKENLEIMQLGGREEKLNFTLSEEDMRQISGLERGHRYFRPEDWWQEMAMAVFD